jgi:hypothetical protein
MAKKGGKTKGAVSAGIHSNVSRALTNSLRRDRNASWERTMNQLKAFREGKRVMVRVPNPDAERTGKPFVRVDARTVWKNPEGIGYSQP